MLKVLFRHRRLPLTDKKEYKKKCGCLSIKSSYNGHLIQILRTEKMLTYYYVRSAFFFLKSYYLPCSPSFGVFGRLKFFSQLEIPLYAEVKKRRLLSSFFIQ